MIKILLMSHFEMANGLKNTLSYFNAKAASNITSINAYVNNCDPKLELAAFMSKLDACDKALIFTDIMGGSVNQLCIPLLTNKNVYVFSGMNLAMLLQATCFNGNENDTEIYSLASVGKEAVICMNNYQFEAFCDEDE